MLPSSPYNGTLCSTLLSLPEHVRLFTARLPAGLRDRGGVVARVAPYFNRGYPVEHYLVSHMERGPFTTDSPADATAVLVPVEPYRTRVGAYLEGSDGLAQMQQHVRDVGEALRAGGDTAALWRRHNVCDHVIVSSHDKGGRVTQRADPAILSNAVLVINTAETTVNEPNDRGKFTHGKDVSAVCSLSFALPEWAQRFGVCTKGEAQRLIPLSFVGGHLGAVRPRVLEQLQRRPFPGIVLKENHAPPAEYMRLLYSSRFCLHVRGTQVQSPRLFEAIAFGCVPFIIADGYELPFEEVLDWSRFSVRVPESQIDRLNDHLREAELRYQELYEGVCAARRFFVYHRQPQPGDAFWMTMLGVGDRIRSRLHRGACVGDPGEEAAYAKQHPEIAAAAAAEEEKEQGGGKAAAARGLGGGGGSGGGVLGGLLAGGKPFLKLVGLSGGAGRAETPTPDATAAAAEAATAAAGAARSAAGDAAASAASAAAVGAATAATLTAPQKQVVADAAATAAAAAVAATQAAQAAAAAAAAATAVVNVAKGTAAVGAEGAPPGAGIAGQGAALNAGGAGDAGDVTPRRRGHRGLLRQQQSAAAVASSSGGGNGVDEPSLGELQQRSGILGFSTGGDPGNAAAGGLLGVRGAGAN